MRGAVRADFAFLGVFGTKMPVFLKKSTDVRENLRADARHNESDRIECDY